MPEDASSPAPSPTAPSDPRPVFAPARDGAVPLGGLDRRLGVHGLTLRFRDDWPNDPPNVYVVGAIDGWILVDTGWGRVEDQCDLAEWCSEVLATPVPPAPRAVVLTHGHPDHAGGAAGFLHRWPLIPVPVLVAQEETTILSRHEPGLSVSVISDGESLRLPSGTLTVLATPGHTGGSLTYLWTPRQGSTRVAMTGDTVLGRLSSWVGPPDGDLDAYLETLSFLVGPAMTAQETVLAPGHGPTGPSVALEARRLRERRLARDAEILSLIPHAATARALAQTIYAGRVPPQTLLPGGMAERTVLGHLVHLVRQGRIRAVPASSRGGPAPGATDPMLTPYELPGR